MDRLIRVLSLASTVSIGCFWLLGVVGCGGGDDDRSGIPTIDGGPHADARIRSDASSQADAMPLPDAAMNAEGPVVELLSPTAPASGDFSSDAIVTQSRFTARCRATTNPDTGDRVDATSVTISANGGGAVFEAFAQPTTTPGEFVADIVVSDFPNGPLEVRCTAADDSEEERQNSDAIATFVDLGPRVQVLTPIANSSYANQAEVVFTVEEEPVHATDTLATPDFSGVRLVIAGTTVPTTNENGTFSATIVFDDPLFDPVLAGEQSLTIFAPNLRTSSPTVREANVVFRVDSEGPEITPITPVAGQLVSGILPIQATVTDPTGVMERSVVATIAGVYEVELTRAGDGNDFSGRFDTRLLGAMVFPNVIIRARDRTGNQNSYGYVIGLDNAPPVISMDPPDMRESRVNSDGELECSIQFDPLGSDSVNDGQTVPQLFEMRARLEDLSNAGTQTSGVVLPVALVDPTSVQLFLLDDTSQAIIVDTDGDGVCDDINPLLVPTSVPSSSDEVAAFDLVEVPTTGSSYFAGDLPPTFADTGNTECVAKGDDTRPKAVCISSPLTRVIETPVGHVDVIYGVPPAEGIQCLGNGIDALATNINDGWACAATRGADKLGNLNVSPVLRLCIDSDLSGDDGCGPMDSIATTGLPNCTGTYDSVTETVNASKPCVVNLVYPENDVRRIDL